MQVNKKVNKLTFDNNFIFRFHFLIKCVISNFFTITKIDRYIRFKI